MNEISDFDKIIFERFGVDGNNGLPIILSEMTREVLAHLMCEFGFTTGAEIGVRRGTYSRYLCDANPNLRLLSIDPWTPFRKNSQEKMDRDYRSTYRRLRRCNAEIVKKTSMDAVRNTPDESLDFVFIDEMHEFDPVMLDLIFWTDKVKRGGIVSGHDYTEPNQYNGVKPAVQAYTQVHNITTWYITGEISDDRIAPSFFWVKP